MSSKSPKSYIAKTLTRGAKYINEAGYIEIPGVSVVHLPARGGIELVKIGNGVFQRSELVITATKISHRDHGWCVVAHGNAYGKFASIADAAAAK